MAQRARVGPAVQVAQDPGHGGWPAGAARWTGIARRPATQRSSQAVLAIAARPAQDMRIRHGTRSSLEWGRRLAGESALYAGSGDMSRTRGLRFGKGIRAIRAGPVHSEYTAFPQATHRLAHRDMHRRPPPLVRAIKTRQVIDLPGLNDRMAFRTEYRRPCPPGWRRCWPGRPAERDAAGAPGAVPARCWRGASSKPPPPP